MEHVRRKIGVSDVILTTVVIVASVALLLFGKFGSSEGAYCLITTPDGEIRRSLLEDARVDIVSCGIELTVVISDGEVFVEKSECPDAVCVKTGAVSRCGQSIVCVPAKLSVTVSGGEAYDADFVLR